MDLNKESSTLGSLSPGDRAEIIGFSIDDSAATTHFEADELFWRERFLQRINEMGFLIGESLEILNEAPMSRDPISVRIKNAVYALRRKDADRVFVRKISS